LITPVTGRASLGVTLLPAPEAHIIMRLGRELPNAASQLLRFLIGRMKAFQAGRR
jgi:hypothetical protein